MLTYALKAQVNYSNIERKKKLIGMCALHLIFNFLII